MGISKPLPFNSTACSLQAAVKEWFWEFQMHRALEEESCIYLSPAGIGGRTSLLCMRLARLCLFHRITEWLNLQKTSKITRSNHPASTTNVFTTKPCPQVLLINWNSPWPLMWQRQGKAKAQELVPCYQAWTYFPSFVDDYFCSFVQMTGPSGHLSLARCTPAQLSS